MKKGGLSIIIFNIFFFLPVLVVLFYAFSSQWKFPDIIPRYFDMHSINFILREVKGISTGLFFSFSYSICAVALTFLLTVLPASVFARSEFPLKSVLEGLLLAPALVPAMAFSTGMHSLFIRAGLSDTFPGLVIVLSCVSYPYMLRALTAGFQAISAEYVECAVNLGAGRIPALFTVEVPLLVPAIISGGSIVFLVSYSEYFLIFLIGGGSIPSYTGYLFPFLNSSDRSTAAMLTLVFLITPVMLFALTDGIILRIYRKKGLL
jgi:putative spermidine/putrescine transport system permease protein